MRVTVCGVGALGSHTVTFIRNLAIDIAVVDGDRVESKNLAGQQFTKQVIGRNKAEATRLLLLNNYGRNCEAFSVRLHKENVSEICGSSDLLVDCFDNAESRRLLSTYSHASGIPLVHAGISADGLFGLVRWDDRFEADEEDEPGQPTCEGGENLPVIALLAAGLALVVREFSTSDRCRDLMVTPGTITTTSVTEGFRSPPG